MNAKKITLVLGLTSIFPFLFYHNAIGVNLLIFNLLIYIGLWFTGKLKLRHQLNLCLFTGTLLTALFVVINGSVLAITINVLSLFLLAGSTLFPEGRNLIYMSLLSIISFFTSQEKFFKLFVNVLPKSVGSSKVFRIIKLTVIPLVVFFVFMLIYKTANPVFEGMVSSFFIWLDECFNWIFQKIEFSLLITIVFGFLLANYFLLGEGFQEIISIDKSSSDQLKVIHAESLESSKRETVKNEYTSAIILFSLLNILILLINMIDVWWVWLHFEWNGEYLKQFVHEGTYLLILSITISLGISIYYFRGNINFIKNNNLLRNLAYIWLGQNALLTLSVGLRNFWYIHYFSLAYLRIGVVFFLLLTLFSIYSVVVKIKHKKSSYFLFRKNALATYFLLVIMAFFNWDIIIAKYNFSHAKTAFIHFDFLADLSPNALPYLIKTEEELRIIDQNQQDEFPFRKQYITSDEYAETIEKKKNRFINQWSEYNWLEWNYAGHRSYQKIMHNTD
jgi:hypothetical protein